MSPETLRPPPASRAEAWPPTPTATGPAGAAGAGLQGTLLLVAPNIPPPKPLGALPSKLKPPCYWSYWCVCVGGGTRCPHTRQRPRSPVSQPDRSQPRVYTHMHPPPPPPALINKSRIAESRPPQPPIGCLAGPAGYFTIPLVPTSVHQRCPSHCLQSVAFCSAPTWRGRIRTGTESGTPPGPGPPPTPPPTLQPGPPQFGLSLLTPATCLPSPGC